MAEALRKASWQDFWAIQGISDPVVQQSLQEGNDPRALAAILEEQALRSDQMRYDLGALSERILFYAGSKDGWLLPAGARERFIADCALVGARAEVLDGLTHVTAFQAKDVVLPIAREFLLAAALT